ncbi:mandelate racemase/muconate lactonizing enzyme family protein [Nocardiopsis sp. RSe5-2]|uniref:Mandelate racemase/muconate lactonizing enzyme family protein n=1 Tax=Nocardiopsis endophytica TaxID=3018445 RepID=A0ABT4UAI8_9ACTN|nr:mandelate racemase/muconate lactonizing enzyme family protein [Nocardiopsis endophytica]MDA2813985.1 mandelate racemase/muconate lactonizing enzyme family protein [Nocardiopsis endophytica]
MRIESAAVRAHRLPLHRSWDGGVDKNDLVVVEVAADTGHTGTGFAWTPGAGAGAVLALVRDDCAPALVGWAPDPGVCWDALRARLADAGSGGVSAMALAAVDIALWDLRAKAVGLPLVELLGRRRDAVPAYASGVNLDYPKDELLDQVRGWKAAGHRAFKVKVGSADPARDADRVAAVREEVGPEAVLMVDANQRWDLPSAVRALGELERFSPAFVEEPLPAEDLRAHARLRARTALPFAMGENLRTERAFAAALEAGVCDVAQPNAVRVGGITPFLRIAGAAAEASVPVAPHLLPELSTQLALCVPRVAMVEDIDRAWLEDLGALERPSGVRVSAGAATADTGPGHGLEFRKDLPPLPEG